MDVKIVNQAEFDATTERLEARRKAVEGAKRLLARAKSPEEAILAAQVLSAARRLKV